MTAFPVSALTRLDRRLGRPGRAALLGVAAALFCLWLRVPPYPALAASLLPLLTLSFVRLPPPVAEGGSDPVSGAALRPHLLGTLARHLDAGPIAGRDCGCVVLGVEDTPALVHLHGQAVHDRVLRKIAERLGAALREHDIVARLEGPRFAVALAPARMNLEAAIQIATRLQAAVAEPLSVEATTIHVTASAGFAMPSRVPARDAATLLAAAELAQEEAQRHGGGALRAYSAEIARSAADRSACRSRIEGALDAGEIVAFFQPQVAADSGAVTGLEALARWAHPDRGILGPAEFLPAILAAGLSQRLGEVMIDRSLRALAEWDRLGLRVPAVSVNFTHDELRDPGLATRLRWELDRFDLAPDRLCIEVLESVTSPDRDDVVARNLEALARLGCRIDLDDFGTGNASIAAIRRFRIHRLKIDRSLVSGIDRDAEQQRILAAVLSMAERLGIETLAEGVETPAEYTLLAQLGCDHVQGFVVARPMAAAEVPGWIAARRTNFGAPQTLRKL